MHYKIVALVLLSFFIVCPELFAQQRQPDFKIGAILSMTGPAEVWGKYARMGAEMAIDEANQRGGLGGRKVTLFLEDSRSSSAGAVTAFSNLLALKNPDVLFGDVWTQFVEPLVPLTTSKKITLISPTVVDSSVSPGPFFLTMGHKPQTARMAIKRFFEINSSIKSVAIFCWDNPWGAAYQKMWKEEIAARNIKITNEICVNDFAYDYRTDVSKVVSQKPDAIIVAHQVERILKLFEENRYHPLVLTTSNVVEVLDNKTLPMKLAEGLYFTNWIPTSEFEAEFRKRYKAAPIMEAYNSYEALRSIFLAYEKNAQNLRDGFNMLAYQGVAGPIDFRNSAAGNNSPAVLVQVRNGIMETVAAGN